MSTFALHREATSAPLGCESGHHVPLRSAISVQGGIRRTICRRCRCALMRTEAARAWIRSGLLG
jgi:RNase P subunit RPR2